MLDEMSITCMLYMQPFIFVENDNKNNMVVIPNSEKKVMVVCIRMLGYCTLVFDSNGNFRSIDNEHQTKRNHYECDTRFLYDEKRFCYLNPNLSEISISAKLLDKIYKQTQAAKDLGNRDTPKAKKKLQDSINTMERIYKQMQFAKDITDYEMRMSEKESQDSIALLDRLHRKIQTTKDLLNSETPMTKKSWQIAENQFARAQQNLREEIVNYFKKLKFFSDSSITSPV